MTSRRAAGCVLSLVFEYCLFAGISFAHPAAGIVVDAKGTVYFIDNSTGVMRLDSSGGVSTIHHGGGHWLALNSRGVFSRLTPKLFERITADGVTPCLIFASGGAPLVVGTDGRVYYGSNGIEADLFPPGARAVARFSADGGSQLYSPLLEQKLEEWKDGITALASGPDGSIYVGTWKRIVKLRTDGSIEWIRQPAAGDCDSDPADHNPTNASSPLFRGLGVDSNGDVYAAATSCHLVLKLSPNGDVASVLKSERPWSPTGIAVSGDDVYVLEYSNANGPATEGWRPRVRKLGRDGSVTTLLTPPQPPPR